MLAAFFAGGPLQFLRFLINNVTYMFQSWTHAVPVNPKLYLLGKLKLGIPDQLPSILMKFKSMQNLKIDAKKILTCQVFS